MSYVKSRSTFKIHIRASVGKLLIVFIPHFLCIGLLLIMFKKESLSFSYLMFSTILVLLSLIYFVKLHISLNIKNSVIKLSKDTSDNWRITTKEGVDESVSLREMSFVSELLIILSFKNSLGKQSSVLISADSVNAEQFRQLKLYLNTNKLDLIS